MSGQYVWFAIFGAGSLVDLEVDAGQLLGPAGLLPVENRGGDEVFEVLVVRVYLYLVICSFELSSPMFE